MAFVVGSYSSPPLASSGTTDWETYEEEHTQSAEDHDTAETAFGTFGDHALSKKTKDGPSEDTPLYSKRARTVSFGSTPGIPKVSSEPYSQMSRSFSRARSSITQSFKLLGKTGSAVFFQQSFILTSSLMDVSSLDRKAGAFLTSMNILCLIQGISIFAMPFVTVYGGVAVILSTVVVGFLNWYTTYLISECQHQVSRSTPGLVKRIYPTYIELGKAVFPRYGASLMKVATLMTMVSGISFFILLGQTSYDLMKSFAPLSGQHWVVIWSLLVFPCLFVTQVSAMAWFSLAALVSFTIVLLAAYVLLFAEWSQWSLNNISSEFSLEYLMVGYGIIHNSYFLHLAVPAIEGSMKEPRHCNKSMALSFALNVVFKVIFQTIGALTFGTSIMQSITTNLSLTVGVSFLINALTAVNLYCSFPISLCVMFAMLDEYVLPHFTVFQKGERSFYGWLFLSRALILTFIVFVAVSIPQFGLVVSFLGNLRSSLLALIFPIYFYLYLKWRHISVLSKVLNVSLLALSILTGIGATYYSLRAIVSKLTSS